MKTSRRAPLLVAVAFVVLGLLIHGTAFTQELLEKVKEINLDNGMKFLVVERHEAPVVFCAIVFNVGSANEWPNVTGISHLLEHMMFKGTEMMGTKNYKKEKPYIDKTDELGERTINLRKEIGEWRFERFNDFAGDVNAAFTDEERESVGADKYKQNKLVVEKIRALESLPDSLTSVAYLIEDDGKNLLDLFLEYELAWGEIHRLLDEQRQFIVKDELWEAYLNNGSRMLNAGTSYDFTVYFVYLPANRLELWMTMESDRMDNPIFREFWSERDVVMEERRLGENDPDEVLEEAFYSVAFTACPYKWPVVGWMSDLLTIDRKELVEYHRVHYAPNNALAVVIGDVDYRVVEKMVKRYFGTIPAQQPPPPLETREPEQRGERRVTVEYAAEPRLMIGYHKPVYPDPDAITMEVLSDVLSTGRTSRFYKTIYEEKELTASPVNSYTGPGNRYDNLLVISAEPRHPHTLEEVEGAVYEELEKLKTEPVTERELQRIKNQMDAQMTRQLGSNLGIAMQLLVGQLFMGDYKGLFKMYERIKEVTPEDVKRVANDYLTQKNRTVAFRVKKEEEKKASETARGTGEIDQNVLRAYIMSLPQEEMMAIVQKFQSMRSEQEAMEYAKELWEQAKAAGFVKETEQEK